MRTNCHINKKGKKTIAVVGDGETEFWYIQMLKRNERTLNIRLEPEIPKKKSLIELFEHVKKSADNFDRVFWLVDLDVILKESRESGKSKRNPLTEFEKYCKVLKKDKYKNVTIIINNPCLEFWFLLHHEYTNKIFNNCGDAAKHLQKHLPGYEKTEKYYTKENNDIYLKLKNHINDAKINAAKFGEFDFTNPDHAISQMHLLFNELEIQSTLISQKF